MYHIVSKLVDENNRIIGARVICKGISCKITKETLIAYRYQFDNAKITSDGKIISKDNIPLEKIKEQKRVILYHGSSDKIIKPEFGGGKDKHDYGNGFYMTENKDLAKEWAVSLGSDGYVHTYSLDITDLKIFDFNNVSELAWLAELMTHRDADTSARYKKFSKQFIQKYKIDISGYDVITGWRADSSFFSIAKRFVRDEIDYDLIGELFHLGGLENQICLKSKKAYKCIKEIAEPEFVLEKEYKPKYDARDSYARQKTQELIESDRNTMTKGFSYVIKEVDL